MKESHGEGTASHPDPESCGSGRKSSAEALTGAHTGQPLSCEITSSGVPTRLRDAEGNIDSGVIGELGSDSTQSKTLRTCGNSSHGNREIPSSPENVGALGRSEKADGRSSGTHDDGKSDGRVVPEKPSNKDGLPTSAEAAAGRRPTEGNTSQQATSRTQSRTDVSFGLERVREAARRDKRARFTALLHHVTIDLLRESFHRLKKQAAAGVDGVTWQEYEVGREDRLKDLHRRIHTGTYRALLSKRVYIPKPDGRMRPLGIAALKDIIL